MSAANQPNLSFLATWDVCDYQNDAQLFHQPSSTVPSRKRYLDGKSVESFNPEHFVVSFGSWKLSEAGQEMTSSESSAAEPLRFVVGNAGPPKRFFRTFWRTIARRLLESERQQLLSLIKP
jgi:hypothetical protein